MTLADTYPHPTADRGRTALRAAPAVARCVIYARLSRDDDGDGVGVDRQERLCRELAERNGWEVAEVCIDNSVSGFSVALGARPGWQRVERLVEAGEVSHVVAYHPDRLSRRMKDIAPLIDRWARTGIEVATVDGGGWDLSSANGIAFAGMGGVMSEWYSRVIGEKVSRAADDRAKNGRAHGGPRPYGYRFPDDHESREVSMIVEPDEAEIVREMAARFLAGESLSAISMDLTERDVPTSAGGKWHTSSISRTITHPRVAGLNVYRGDVVGQGDWEPILDRETWERVCARHRATRGTRTRSTGRVALLAGLIYCAECGHRMSTGYSGLPVTKKRPEGGRIRMYRCTRTPAAPDACSSCACRAEPLEDDVTRQVLATLARTNLASQHVSRSVADSRELVETIARDEAELDTFAADLAAGRLTRREWEVLRPPVHARIVENRERLESIETDSDVPAGVWSGITPEVWDGYTLAERRAVVRVLVAGVHVSKGERGRTWDGSRMRIEWRLS